MNELTQTKRVVIYIRVSTTEQAREGYSIEAQKDRLIAYCKARGWTIVEVIVDPGYSGANLERPGIQHLIENIKDYDMVLIYKLDRLSRSQRDTLYIIEEIFNPNGVGLASLSESLDTSTPHGMAMIGILSSFAQLERATINERTEMGRVERFKEGKFHGGTPPIGYDYSRETGTLVVNEYEAMQVRLAFRLYVGTADEPGVGYKKVSEELQARGFTTKYGDWRHIRTVVDVITNRACLGEIHYKGFTIENAHEAIIDRETFDRAQLIRQTRDDKHKGATRGNSLLTGFLWCGECGARCIAVKRNFDNDLRRYVCYSRLKTTPVMVRDPDCPGMSWAESDLDAVVDYEIRSLVFDKNYLRRLLHRDDPAPAAVDNGKIIRDQIAVLDKKIERLMDLYAENLLPVDLLNERVKSLNGEREALRSTLMSSGEAAADVRPDEDDTREYLDEVGAIWDKADITQKREILSVLVDKVWIYSDNTVQIEWTFT